MLLLNASMKCIFYFSSFKMLRIVNICGKHDRDISGDLLEVL